MDENRIAGTARNVGGKVEEGLGRVTDYTRMRTEGLADQAAGVAQDLYGQARDSAADAAGAARDSAAAFEKRSRRTIETQPYTTAMVAIGSTGCLDRCIVRLTCDLCDDTGWVCEDHADRPLRTIAIGRTLVRSVRGCPARAAIATVDMSRRCRGCHPACG